MSTNRGYQKITNEHKHSYSEYEERFQRTHKKELRNEERNRNRKGKRSQYDDDYYYEEEE